MVALVQPYEEESTQTMQTPPLSPWELSTAWELRENTAVEDIAHREDDVAVSLVEVAVSTQGHQRQLHFLNSPCDDPGVVAHSPEGTAQRHSGCLPGTDPLSSEVRQSSR